MGKRNTKSRNKSRIACRKAAAAARAAAAIITAAQPAESPAAILTGLQVVESGGRLGKVAIATRDFQPREVVLLEPPAVIVGLENGYFGLFEAFLAAPADTQTAILDMMYPPITTTETDDPMEAERKQRDIVVDSEWRRYQRQYPAAAQELIQADPDRAKKLVRIVGNNAHTYHRTATGDRIANLSSGGPHNEVSALYVLGSKVEHSCVPNLHWCTDQGLLCYTAETPIARGDRLSISYASSELQLPRSERQKFLLENKAFLCQCRRCVGPDECRPLCCDRCQQGVLFQHGSDHKWRCVVSSCSESASVSMTSLDAQQRVESEQQNEMNRLRDSLQYGIEESTLDVVTLAQARIVETRHPLHWLHVAAWDLVSIVASSFARYLMRTGCSPGRPQVAGLLRLSATCQLHQILWTERNASISYGRCPVQEAVAGIATNGIPRLGVAVAADTVEIGTLLDRLTAPQHRPPQDCTEILHTMFHAGQDILLAGHPALAARLYSRYAGLFLGSPWAFSEKTRDNFRVLVQSGGKENHFGNHLLPVD